MPSSRILALTGPACIVRSTNRIYKIGVTYARRDVKVVPMPEPQACPFSETCPEGAHINEAINYVRELGKPFSIWLVPEVAGTWVFFEARHLMFVSDIYQCLRVIAQLVAKSNSNFVSTG